MQGDDGFLRTAGDGAGVMVTRYHAGCGEVFVGEGGGVGGVQKLECD